MSRARWIALLVIVIVGGLIRWYAMERTFPVQLLGDERYYVNTALNIAQGRGHVFKKSSRVWRPGLGTHFVRSSTAGSPVIRLRNRPAITSEEP